MISKSLSTSEKFASLTTIAGELAEFCQVLYPLIVSHADDFGRLQGDAFTVKHMCFPTSPRSKDQFAQGLSYLQDVTLIQWYQVEDKKYVQVLNFEAHQQGLHKRTESVFPEFPGSSGKFRVARARGTELKGTELKRRELKGTKDKNSGVPPPSLAAFPRNPSENVKIITKIAHEVLKSINGHAYLGSDVVEDIKTLCAKRKIAYDAEVVRKALDSAEVQRKAAR
jgi:hypothetical protein